MAWIETRLKYLSSIPISNGLGESGTHTDPSWPRYVRTTDIAGPRSLREDVFASLPPQIAARAMLKKGDVLATAAGATIGKSVTYLEQGPACYAGFLVRFRPGPAVDGRFIGYWMQSHAYWDQVNAGAVRSTIDNFSAGKYRELRLALPPLKEQRRIAAFLDDQVAFLDRAINLRQQQIQLLSERRSAQLSAHVLALAQAYGWTPLRRFLTSIVDGPFGSSLTSAHYADKGARVIRLGNLGIAWFREADEAFIPLDYYDRLSQHSVRAGDLLIAGLGDENNPLGRACVAPAGLGPAIVKADCYRVRLDPGKITHEYAALVMSSSPVTGATKVLSRGSTRARINTELAREIRLPVPPLVKQQELVARLRSQSLKQGRMDALLHASLVLVRERKQALISAAVTGAFDVTTTRRVTADV